MPLIQTLLNCAHRVMEVATEEREEQQRILVVESSGIIWHYNLWEDCQSEWALLERLC